MAAPIIRTTEEEALFREMERVSLDWCMIYNPTDKDFFIEWAARDGRPWKYLVPGKNKDIGWGKGKLEVQRYLAIWYCKHMTDQIINDKGQKEAEKILADRREKGSVELTKFEEQKAIWDKTPRTNSNKELGSLYPILFLGISREFGQDYLSEDEEPYMADMSSAEEKAFAKLKDKKYAPDVEESEDENADVVPVKKAPQKPKSEKELPSLEELEALMPTK